jgi:GTP-binding protein HflX
MLFERCAPTKKADLMSERRFRDRTILVGVGLKPESPMSLRESLAELSELIDAAGGETVGQLVQSLESWNPATLMGSGKVDEIREMVRDTKATMVAVDHQLSGVQQRNLNQALGVDVVDRTQVILDIFAQRARTHEGKLQVELAQLLDRSSRMVGGWLGSLSRQGGGIGTRGPGEKAIETDRRVIRDRITRIRRDLEEVRQHRSLHRSNRRSQKVPSFALIGYTNAGKSTLLNNLTKSDVFSENQLFATLDPTTRKVFLPDSPPAVVTDTVGFIRKLPTNLIEAFKATLEESEEADVLLHVVDLSSRQWKQQMEVVQKLIEEFQWTNKPIVHVFNKMDTASPERKFQVKESPRIFASALTGEGIDNLKAEMVKQLQAMTEEIQLFFPHALKHKMFDLGREALVTRQEESTQGVICYVKLTPASLQRWAEYRVLG